MGSLKFIFTCLKFYLSLDEANHACCRRNRPGCRRPNNPFQEGRSRFQEASFSLSLDFQISLPISLDISLSLVSLSLDFPSPEIERFPQSFSLRSLHSQLRSRQGRGR